MFPNGWDITMVDGKVEEVSEKLGAIGTKVPEM